MRTVITLALALAALGPCHASGTFTVCAGETKAIIVYQTDADKETKQAYEDLALYLRMATVKDFATMPESGYTPTLGPAIHVGWTQEADRLVGQELRRLDRAAQGGGHDQRHALLRRHGGQRRRRHGAPGGDAQRCGPPRER